MSEARPLIVGFLKVRDENVREGNIHRCLTNMRRFCDTIVACDDGSADGTRQILEREIPPDQLILVDPKDHDFRNELRVKQRMMAIVDRLRPHWVWWQDGDEELEPAGVNAIRKLCEEQKDSAYDAYRFHYIQLWQTALWHRVDDGFNEGSYLKLWKWNPGLRFVDEYGTHHQQFPQQINLGRVPTAPWKIVHWGNYGKNLVMKSVQYWGGLGGVERHLSFEQGRFEPVDLKWLGREHEEISVEEAEAAYPWAFSSFHKECIKRMRGLKHEPATFTVVIPTFNRAWALPKTLQSLLDQTYQKWVAVVLDDGSTDGTVELMRKWQDIDPRIFYARYPKLGAVALNEIGMDLACSWTEWWTRLGSDDYFEPHKLELDAMVLSVGAELVYGPYRVLRGDDLAEMCNLPMPEGKAREVLLGGGFCLSWANIAAASSLLARVKAHYGNYCDPRLKTMEDFLVNTRLVRFADPMFRCKRGRTYLINPTPEMMDAAKGSDHDAIWRVAPDGASSNTVTTGNEDELTRKILAEENEQWRRHLEEGA